MSYFKNVCLLKAPQAFNIPNALLISDLTEICYLAAMIVNDVERVSIPVGVYDNVYGGFTKFLKANPVDLVGISTMTGAFNNALRLAKIAKRFDKFVVMGGYHPSALYEDVLQSPYVDAVIVGQGEKTLQELVVNGPSKNVLGMAIKENGAAVFAGTRPIIKDLDSIPHPLRKARPLRFGEPGDDYSIDTIYTSRGCPWNCTFCANDKVNKQWKGRSPENVVEELASLHDPRRKRFIKIYDANFFTSVERVEKICDLMIENGLTNFKIWAETRVDDIVRAERIMDKLSKIGLKRVGLGIESPNQETLELMNKKSTTDVSVKAVEILNQYKIRAQGYFIIGHYSETVEDTRRYPEFAEALGLRHSTYMVMTPYPGTRIFEEYKKENKIRSFDWDLYNNFCTVIETRSMDTKTLNEMYASAWGKFYTRWVFFNEKKSFGMIFLILQHCYMLYHVFKIQKHNTRSDIKEFLFKYINANAGRQFSRPYPMKAPFLLRFFKHITIRFTHSTDKKVDFRINQKENSRELSISEADDGNLVRGPVIQLDDIITQCEKVSHETAVGMAIKLEAIRNSPRNRLRNILVQLKDKDLFLTIFPVGWFIFRTLSRGVVSIFLHSVMSRLKSSRLGSKSPP
jgi:magnesium-protoporphyrin IX monomethyl ester (oxidative) cyclase